MDTTTGKVIDTTTAKDGVIKKTIPKGKVLPAEIMAALEAYYSPLETVLTLLRFQDAAIDSADRGFKAYIQQEVPEWNVAATSDPYREYLERALAAQRTVLDRINGYLALSMADAPLRLLGRFQPRTRKPS